jgi:hypothetical protein
MKPSCLESFTIDHRDKEKKKMRDRFEGLKTNASQAICVAPQTNVSD